MHNIGTKGHDADELWTMDTERKSDINNILIIIAVALGLGVYSIATTVVISKDGVGYIEQARQFYSDPHGSLRTHHPGYPLLIFATHRFACLFIDGSSVFAWIYSAQIITLLFRLLALIPLYLMSKWLVGTQRSFYAMLILIVLPNPAKMSCEVTREWPYLFLLAAGFMFLLWGARRGVPWASGLAGLSAGIGYWIRPECGQIVIYGLGWVILSLFLPAIGKMTRRKSLATSAILLVGFAFPTLAYVKYTGNTIAPNTKRVIRLISLSPQPKNAESAYEEIGTMNRYAAGFVLESNRKVWGEIFKAIGENLMWFFLPFMFTGFYYHMRCEARIEERFLLSIFILTNMVIMFARYRYVEAHISSRWTLALVAFTILYIPVGLQMTSRWLGNKRQSGSIEVGKPRLFFILLLIGTATCLPKLLRPAGADKQGFRTAAKWLRENTYKEDILAVPDNRISFYAEREGLLYETEVPEKAKYVVKIMDIGNKEAVPGTFGLQKYSGWVDEREKERRIVIYLRITPTFSGHFLMQQEQLSAARYSYPANIYFAGGTGNHIGLVPRIYLCQVRQPG